MCISSFIFMLLNAFNSTKIRNVFVRTLEYRSTKKMPSTDLCCNNKKFYRNNTERPVEYKWSLWQRVASSENETSESSRDNFSTSKPVDMFDSNLSQPVRGVDRPTHLLPIPSNSFLRTKWPITKKSRFLLKNSADHGSCPEEFGSPLFADENTNSEMFRTISTRLWQRKETLFYPSLIISDRIFFQPFLLAWIIHQIS